MRIHADTDPGHTLKISLFKKQIKCYGTVNFNENKVTSIHLIQITFHFFTTTISISVGWGFFLHFSSFKTSWIQMGSAFEISDLDPSGHRMRIQIQFRIRNTVYCPFPITIYAPKFKAPVNLSNLKNTQFVEGPNNFSLNFWPDQTNKAPGRGTVME
jgi:hypothetical protein